MSKGLQLSGPALAVLAGVAAVSVVGLYAWSKGGVKGAAKGLGEAVGGGAVSLVDGVFTGSVLGIGDAVGIPRTNESECEKAKREGRSWDASFACPAGDFLGYIFSGGDVGGAADPAPKRTDESQEGSDSTWQWLPNFGWGS